MTFGKRCLTFFTLVAVGSAMFVAQAAAQAPLGASTPVQVEVTSGTSTAPFDVPRTLNVPPDFRISVLARVPGARFMAVAPNGDVLVSQPRSGAIKLLRTGTSGTTVVSDFARNLRLPHDIVFHTIGADTFIYVGESHQIIRIPYVLGDSTARSRHVVVGNLPDASTPELKGAHGHQLKNIALDRAHNLYVSMASATNASVSDRISDPVRCAIYRYAFQPGAQDSESHGPGVLMARGLRNAAGLAFVPGTDDLWVVVNNRDNIKYPFRGDISGDGVDDYGKVVPSYVDDHPPDEFIHVREGADYGWPYANPDPKTAAGMDNMPFDPDYDNNPDWSVYPESTFTRVDKGIQAHSAPLGLSFLQDTQFPSAYRSGAVIALRGSWNRQEKTGYKVIYFPWSASTSRPGAQLDLVTGWLEPSTQTFWGRPVDAVPDLAGNLLISDDFAGAIYKLTYSPAPPPPPPPPDEDVLSVQSFSLVNTAIGLDIAGFEAIKQPSVAVARSSLPASYSLRANLSGDVGSVMFSYNDMLNYRTENTSPYCVRGDLGRPDSICNAWPDGMKIGTHTVVATPFSGPNRTGTPGQPLTLTLTIEPDMAVTSVALVNTITGLDVPGYAAMTGGLIVIDQAALPASYGLRADTIGAIKSVVFDYNGRLSYRLENSLPYCIRGDLGKPDSICNQWPDGMVPGVHRVTVTPYSAPNATGATGLPFEITLDIR